MKENASPDASMRVIAEEAKRAPYDGGHAAPAVEKSVLAPVVNPHRNTSDART